MLIRSNEALAKRLVFIDGFSSTGKSLLGPLFGHMNDSEFWQIEEFHEHISILNYLGELATESGLAVLETKLDKLLYHLSIGRGINYRESDDSSPVKFFGRSRYDIRMLRNDLSAVTDELLHRPPILPMNVHFLYGHTSFLYDVLRSRIELYVLMMRRPAVLAKLWHDGNWTRRIGGDPKEFTLSYRYGRGGLPWFTRDYKDEYSSASAADRSILTVVYHHFGLVGRYVKQGVELRNKLLPVFFEDYISNPIAHVNLLCDITNSKISQDCLARYLSLCALPRDIQADESINEKVALEFFNENATPECYGLLLKATDSYHQFKDTFRKVKV